MSPLADLPPTGVVVIGAGLPRTGTTSMKLALELLLGGRCYHMRDVFKSKGKADVQFWSRAIRRNVSDEVSKGPRKVEG